MMEQPEKAVMKVYWHQASPEEIPFQYNPGEWTFEKAVQLKEITIPGLDAPLLQFVRGQNENITLEIFFDSTEDGLGAGATSVTEKADKFYQLVKIEPTRHAPPICELVWNNKFPGCDLGERVGNQRRNAFKCLVEKVRHKYTMFSSKGVPLRAVLTLTLREYKTLEQQLAELNLSSPDRTHAHVLDRGQTLSAVAGQYYQRPGRWRAVAEANGIDDPRRLDAGAVLTIPVIE